MGPASRATQVTLSRPGTARPGRLGLLPMDSPADVRAFRSISPANDGLAPACILTSLITLFAPLPRPPPTPARPIPFPACAPMKIYRRNDL